MSREIIGHGTWLDKVAFQLLERERSLGRKQVIKAESGLGASGIPHIGSLSDCLRAYGVKLAVEELGHKSKYIAFSDDMDGLRKVPAGLPSSLKEYLGFPVTSIPDPFSCHQSYGDHMSSLLLDALDRCGVEYEFLSAAKAYREGLFKREIMELLANAKRVGELIKEELGQEKYVEALPYFPVCSNCNRIYTTRAYEFLPEEGRVLYTCEGMEVGGQLLKGCGFKGEASCVGGGGKLSWKVEFAARWRALGIVFEAYGKDIADSVRMNDRICQEVLDYPPPYHVRYEMFLDKGGRKISKSLGNVFTPQVWFRYGSPQSLLLLMYKRVTGTREIDVTDIPRYMDELKELEDIYVGKREVKDRVELAKLRGVYSYCWLLKTPEKPRVHVPYNLLVYLAKVAPRGREKEFIAEKLRGYGYRVESVEDELGEEIEYAASWAKDFAEIGEIRVEMTEAEREAVRELTAAIRKEEDEGKVQNLIYNVARSHGVEVKDFFKLLYRILIGRSEGPRLGPYIVAMGLNNVAEALERAVEQT